MAELVPDDVAVGTGSAAIDPSDMVTRDMTKEASVTIGMLGGFVVQVDGATIDDSAWAGRRAVELVQLLALSQRRELLRDQVIEALWPHLDPVAGAANLRKAAHHARRALGAPDAVVLRGGRVSLFPTRVVDVDVAAFEEAAAKALTSGSPEECAAVADTWRGELLPASLYEEWTQEQRARVGQLQVSLAKTASRWREVVTLDPTDEHAYQQLIQLAIESGARSAGIRWYGRLRAVLARELGVRPDDTSQALYDMCLAGLAAPTPRLVGRAKEVAKAEALLRDRERTPRGALAVQGPAGIGKTALCREIVRTAEGQAWSTIVVSADESSMAYASLRSCIEALLIDGPAPLAHIPRHARSVLATLSPLAQPADPPEGPLSRHQVIGALQQLLLAVAGGRPVLLALDDAHQADDATLEALTHMASTARDVLVVVAHRDKPLKPALQDGLKRLQRAGRLATIDLGPLVPDDVAALVRELAAGDLVDSVVDSIVDRAAGNPFVAVELARAGDPDALSTALSQVITGRLVDVEPATQAVLRRVALASDEFDSGTIIALTGDTEDAAFRVLDQALDAGVLVVHGSRYRFVHDLVRQALIEEVPPHQRIAVHRDVARRLTIAAAPAAAIGRHWLAAGRPEDAVPWLLKAASEAMQLGAFADARQQVASVLAHDPRHPVALRLDAEALDMMGDPAALRAYDAAIAVATEDDRGDLTAMRALAQLKQGDPPGALDTIDGAGPISVAGRLSEALTYAGAAALGFTDPTVGTTKAAECRRLALESGDSAAIVVASWAHAAAAHARGELHESVLADLYDTKDLPHLATRVFDGHLCITQRFLYGSRPYRDVIEFADRLAAEGARLGAARGHAFGVTLRGEAELLSGRLDEARVDLSEGRRLHHAIGGATGEALALQRRAELAIRQGDRGDARALLADALDLARVTDIGFHLLDRIYGTRIELAIDPEDALAAVAEAEDAVRGPLETCPGCRITFAVPAAVASARGGDIERARKYEAACELLAHVVMRLPAWDAAYTEVRGHVANAEGNHERARALFAEAAAQFATSDQPWDRDRCRELASTAPH